MPSTIDLQQDLPVVDQVNEVMPSFSTKQLSGTPKRSLVDAVRTACLETGFFCLELDARQRAVVDRTIGSMRQFFAIDDDDQVKRRVVSRTGGYGWIPRYSEPAYQPGTVSKLEAFEFGVENLAEIGFWPDSPDFAATATACWQEYLAIANSALTVLALAAGLDAGFLIRNCNSRELNTMRLLHYAAEHDRIHERSVGIAAHTDFECMTLLYQTEPGLELFDARGRWVDVPVNNGRLIVMLDDMLERWTNGYFRATGHRVRDTDRQRFSIVMFVAANSDVTIAPLDEFVSASHPARYGPVTQEDHIEAEVRRARENAERLAATAS
ncbi:MAG TPA: 2OG-Fe(II) oxygenase family protein [Gammaproteobacteria bacterium]|nr:2OG-Fe(II) oxygenase family protein [Gammaproteobacteria bacterium]